MYADTALGRVEASPGLQGTCPSCGHPCRPKCGKINVWHWAHHARADCDPWAEPMTEWHRGWQLAVPPERREVVMGPHRADIVTASGGVVEIQHSPVSPDVIAEREEFYGERMAWIFNATRAHITVRQAGAWGEQEWIAQGTLRATAWTPLLANTPLGGTGETRLIRAAERQWKPSPEVRFRWKYARRAVVACRRLVLLDLGDGQILRPTGNFAPADEMTGALYTRASVEGWLRDGAQWERIILPPAEHIPPEPRPNLGPPDAAARVITETQAERDRQRES